MKKILKVGFIIPGDGSWNGGINYLRNLLIIIKEFFDNEIEPVLFISPDQIELVDINFKSLLNNPPIIDKHVKNAGIGIFAASSIILGRDIFFANLVRKYNIDVMFESARFFGNKFPIPVISWIPDFQHKHLPQYFSFFQRIKREIGFISQCKSKRIILLSSHTASKDCQNFYHYSKNKIKVARFFCDIPLNDVLKSSNTILNKFSLPKKFFFLPNQFWQHKNHIVVLKALSHINKTLGYNNVPIVVMTGSKNDSRNPGLFKKIMQLSSQLGLNKKFIHLGQIEYKDVLALNLKSQAVLNPSKFEGWSSAVEETLNIGSELILSDIPVHREQCSDAFFFQADDYEKLASIMLERLSSNSSKNIHNTQNSRYNRKLEFANDFKEAITVAYNNK